MRKTIFIFLISFGLCGCTSLEKVAYKTVVAAKAFTETLKAGHSECGTDVSASTPFCSNLRTLIAAKDLIIDAGELYCSGGGFETGSPCNPPAKGTGARDIVTQKLQAALSNYSQIEKDFKEAYSLKGAK